MRTNRVHGRRAIDSGEERERVCVKCQLSALSPFLSRAFARSVSVQVKEIPLVIVRYTEKKDDEGEKRPLTIDVRETAVLHSLFSKFFVLIDRLARSFVAKKQNRHDHGEATTFVLRR